MPQVSISDAEWEVMHVLWDAAPLAAQEVIARLRASRDWSPSTIKTMLHRLVRKRALSYVQDGNRYVYRPRARRDACVRQAGESFLERVFGGEPSALVAHFLQSTRLTPADVAALRRMLDERDAPS